MVRVHTLDISPPVINASCAWASDYNQLRDLYDCPFTGAVTTRTATLNGFEENAGHAVAFASTSTSTLNSYGYSPHPLSSYLDWISTILSTPTSSGKPMKKPIIISVTAPTPTELEEMIVAIQALRMKLKTHLSRTQEGPPPDASDLVAIELNTSCPNIKNTPPPSYDFPSLLPFLGVLSSAFIADPTLTIGLKLPPYLYTACFHKAASTIASFSHTSVVGSDSDLRVNPFAFITCTNTLGSSLLFGDQIKSRVGDMQTLHALPSPLGGLGGEAIHPIALGNVFAFSEVLSSHSDPAVRGIKIFGVGGVLDSAGARRMFLAGAAVVGCATLLGEKGVSGFELVQP